MGKGTWWPGWGRPHGQRDGVTGVTLCELTGLDPCVTALPAKSPLPHVLQTPGFPLGDIGDRGLLFKSN